MNKEKSGFISKLINFLVIIIILLIIIFIRSIGITALIIFIIYRFIKGYPSLLMIIGRNRYSLIGPDEGIRWFKKAYLSRRLSVTNQIFYAYVLLKHEKIEESGKVLDKLTDTRLTKYEAASLDLNYSLYNWKKGDSENSLKHAEKAFNNIKNTVIYGTLGFLKIEYCGTEEALIFNKEAYSYNSQDIVISDNYAQSLINSGDLETAEEILKKITEGKAVIPEPYYNLGRIYSKKGMKAEAKVNLEKALSLNFSTLSSLKREQVESELQKLGQETKKLNEATAE